MDTGIDLKNSNNPQVKHFRGNKPILGPVDGE
jgi:hypothetical protein